VIDWYSTCKRSEETLNHILLYCEAARELWIMVFQLFGVEWVMPRWVVDLLARWKRKVGQNDIKFCLECNSLLFNVMHLEIIFFFL